MNPSIVAEALCEPDDTIPPYVKTMPRERLEREYETAVKDCQRTHQQAEEAYDLLDRVWQLFGDEIADSDLGDDIEDFLNR